MGYVKVIYKRKRKKEYFKNGQVSETSKIMGTQMPSKKRDE